MRSHALISVVELAAGAGMVIFGEFVLLLSSPFRVCFLQRSMNEGRAHESAVVLELAGVLVAVVE